MLVEFCVVLKHHETWNAQLRPIQCKTIIQHAERKRHFNTFLELMKPEMKDRMLTHLSLAATNQRQKNSFKH